MPFIAFVCFFAFSGLHKKNITLQDIHMVRTFFAGNRKKKSFYYSSFLPHTLPPPTFFLPFFNVPPPPIHFFASCVKDFSIFKACSSHFCHLTLLVLSCLCLFAFKFVSFRLCFFSSYYFLLFYYKKMRNLFIRMTNISKNRRLGVFLDAFHCPLMCASVYDSNLSIG